MVAGPMQRHNESNVTNNEIHNSADDETDRGEQLDMPGVASAQPIQESDGQKHKTERAQGSLSGVSIY